MEQTKSFAEKLRAGLGALGAYLGEVGVEFKRISWPGRQELKESTGVVIVFILILAVVLLVCDKIIKHALSAIHGI